MAAYLKKKKIFIAYKSYLIRVIVEHTAVREHIHVRRTRTRTQTTLGLTVSVVDEVIPRLALFALFAKRVVATIPTITRFLVARVRMTITIARHTVEHARSVAFYFVEAVLAGLTRISTVIRRTIAALHTQRLSIGFVFVVGLCRVELKVSQL